MKILKHSGKFLTVCGPVQYIGETKLSWMQIIGMIGYVIIRSLFAGLRGPSYKFSEKMPKLVMDDIFDLCEREWIQMAMDHIIPLNLTS